MSIKKSEDKFEFEYNKTLFNVSINKTGRVQVIRETDPKLERVYVESLKDSDLKRAANSLLLYPINEKEHNSEDTYCYRTTLEGEIWVYHIVSRHSSRYSDSDIKAYAEFVAISKSERKNDLQNSIKDYVTKKDRIKNLGRRITIGKKTLNMRGKINKN